MSAQPVRFTFDIDMGRSSERKSSLSDNALAELLAEARREAHAAGLAEGERTATARAEKEVATAAEALAGKVAAMAATLDDARKQAIAEAVNLALSIARKLAGRQAGASEIVRPHRAHNGTTGVLRQHQFLQRGRGAG